MVLRVGGHSAAVLVLVHAQVDGTHRLGGPGRAGGQQDGAVGGGNGEALRGSTASFGAARIGVVGRAAFGQGCTAICDAAARFSATGCASWFAAIPI